MLLIQWILYAVLFITLLRWGLSDRKNLWVSDASMKQMLLLFAIVFIIYLYITLPSFLGIITLIEGLIVEGIAGFVLWIYKQQHTIDYLCLLIAFVSFPFLAGFAFGLTVIIQVVNKKVHPSNYQQAFIWLYFISFVIASLILIPFLTYIKF